MDLALFLDKPAARPRGNPSGFGSSGRLWLRAQAAEDVDEWGDGNAVTTMYNLYPNVFPASIDQQTVGNRPTMQTGALGSMAAIEYGVGDFFEGFAPLFDGTEQTFAAFLTFQRSNNAGNYMFVDSPLRNLAIQVEAGEMMTYINTARSRCAAPTVDRAHVYALKWDGTKLQNSTITRVWLDGVQQVLSFDAAQPASLNGSDSDGFELGRPYSTVGVADWQGLVGDFIVLSPAPSDANMTKIMGHLRAIYRTD